MVKNKSKEQPPKSLIDIMREARAAISVPIRSGFANITFEMNHRDELEMRVMFLGEEGYSLEDAEAHADDVVKVGKLVEELRAVRLQDYAKSV